MTTIARLPSGWFPPEVVSLLEGNWPFGSRHAVHVEDFVENGTYVVRAELPGLDPESDIEVSTSGGRITINARREQETHDKQRTEFRYGEFSRTLTLPPGARADAVSASYRKGILEIRVPLADEPQGRTIPIGVAAE
ncbi:hypothetical protein GCM10010492_53930 [Saccharothrix mutabilis subsp. mutabilis]|uniref:SHSP domain-containing protein n=1 Tax=Saccharothrix mutabilis subsp. mutabilis TaxID=66855 RepID=A0ABN0UDZ1_9PSEU